MSLPTLKNQQFWLPLWFENLLTLNNEGTESALSEDSTETVETTIGLHPTKRLSVYDSVNVKNAYQSVVCLDV